MEQSVGRRAGSISYDKHPAHHVKLDQAEVAIIAGLSAPVHIFWVPILRLKPDGVENWPKDRVLFSKAAGTATVSAVFVTYQSILQPVPNLGNFGDLWVTPNTLFWKEEGGNWRRWVPRFYFHRCPYDAQRGLMLSHWAEFKYAGPTTAVGERREWALNRVPRSCIPLSFREQIPRVADVIETEHRKLEEADVTLLFNVRLDYIRLGDEAAVLAAHQVEPAQNQEQDEDEDLHSDPQGETGDGESLREEDIEQEPAESQLPASGPGSDVNFSEDSVERIPVEPQVREPEDGGGEDVPTPEEQAEENGGNDIPNPQDLITQAPPEANSRRYSEKSIQVEPMSVDLQDEERPGDNVPPTVEDPIERTVIDTQLSEGEVEVLLDEVDSSQGRSPIQSPELRAQEENTSMEYDSADLEDMDIDPVFEAKRQQFEEHISVIDRLVETMRADVEGGDEEWLDSTASDVRMVALLAKDILARRDPGQPRVL